MIDIKVLSNMPKLDVIEAFLVFFRATQSRNAGNGRMVARADDRKAFNIACCSFSYRHGRCPLRRCTAVGATHVRPHPTVHPVQASGLDGISSASGTISCDYDHRLRCRGLAAPRGAASVLASDAGDSRSGFRNRQDNGSIQTSVSEGAWVAFCPALRSNRRSMS